MRCVRVSLCSGCKSKIARKPARKKNLVMNFVNEFTAAHGGPPSIYQMRSKFGRDNLSDRDTKRWLQAAREVTHTHADLPVHTHYLIHSESLIHPSPDPWSQPPNQWHVDPPPVHHQSITHAYKTSSTKTLKMCLRSTDT